MLSMVSRSQEGRLKIAILLQHKSLSPLRTNDFQQARERTTRPGSKCPRVHENKAFDAIRVTRSKSESYRSSPIVQHERNVMHVKAQKKRFKIGNMLFQAIQ